MKVHDPLYLSENFTNNVHLLSIIKKQAVRNQQAIAELMGGLLRNHSFYVSANKDCTAQLDDLENVPYFFDNCLGGPALATAMGKIPAGNLVEIGLNRNTKIRFAPQCYTREILSLIDGITPLEKIFAQVLTQLDAKVTAQELLEDFRPVYQALLGHSLLLLRDKSVPAYPLTGTLEQRVNQLY